MRYWLTTLFLVPASLLGPGEDTPEKLIEETLKAHREMKSVLEGIKDLKTAQAARPKLLDLGKRQETLTQKRGEALKDPKLRDNLLALVKKHQQELRAALKGTELERDRVYDLPGVDRVFRDVLVFRPNVLLEETRRNRTALDLQELTAAIETYNIFHKKYPPTLDVLVKKEAGGGIPLLEAKYLTDPWGRHYVYNPSQRHPETGVPLIYSLGQRPGDPAERLSNWVGPAKEEKKEKKKSG
jgi:hypothetical protein